MTEKVSFYVDSPEAFHFWLSAMEYADERASDASKAEIHQAIFETARAHEQEVVERLGEDEDNEEDEESEGKPDGHIFDLCGVYPEEGDSE